ncbi:VWA domain-containing protein [Comamonas sp. Y6]|uniref:VWA domain-containing protein n=1 Tax=Comamonas resistens TaxID=3046670 RepID=A0ABY8SQN2_9BURK|nr:VWA domain-containing protein [Comamonas resistens]MDL5035828.1 VWA domain-containing protein [Comamonas resistens]WHS65238.1 VWA domain-containing protein [Comamonas resistens]HBP0978972.1 VWA domain-containing protein [Pseudomonas aeruginosa]
MAPSTASSFSNNSTSAWIAGDDAHALELLAMLASGLALTRVNVQPLQAANLPQAAGGLFGSAAAKPASAARAILLPHSDAASASAAQLLLPPLPELSNVDRSRMHTAMVAHAAAHLTHSPARQPSQALKPMGMTVVSAMEDARVERLLLRDYPGVRRWFTEQLADEPEAENLSFLAFMARLDRILLLPNSQSGNHWINKARELFEKAVQTHGLEDYAAFRAISSILANDLGQMRVRMDPQHYVSPTLYRDDNSYLWEHPESDDSNDEALSLAQTAARPPPAQSSPQQESIEPQPLGQAQDFEIARFHYPEWDSKSEHMKADWCTVIEKFPAWQGLSEINNSRLPSNTRIDSLALPNARQLDRRHRLRRQWEGEDVDLNAAIEVQVDMRLNLRPDPRLFMRTGKGPRPTSILVLLDISESVNDIGPCGQCLLNLEKQAALMLAQSSTRGTGRLAIHAFSSNTRAEVNYYRLLDFGQPHTSATAAMIQSMRGRFSTRLGAAMRHACGLLRSEPEDQQTLLVVTDGAPADIDVHDKKYLIEDARHAVQEAKRAGVRVCCLAVDAQADAYVRHIFGWRDYSIADDAEQLVPRLTRMNARLAAGR